MSRRFPPGLYEEGTEPDPRFSLANERTLLAWIRTSLALIAGGVAVETLAAPLQPGLRLATSILLLGSGLLASVQAWAGWRATELSMRHERPLPSPVAALPLVVAVCAAGIVVLLAVLLT